MVFSRGLTFHRTDRAGPAVGDLFDPAAGGSAIGFLEIVRKTLTGEPGLELLDQPTLRRRIVAGILDLRQRGRRGVDQLPSAVTVRIRVPANRLEVVRRLVDEPVFDQDVADDLLNRLVGPLARTLPVRHYDLDTAEQASVEVEPATERPLLYLWVEGGDRDGQTLPLVPKTRLWHLGRGPWHRPQTVANDLVVCDDDRFVSRRAALLHLAGSGLEIEPLDQGDCLVVIRDGGKRVRPTHVPAGRVRIGEGDTLELHDGADHRVRLHLVRQVPTTSSGKDPDDRNSEASPGGFAPGENPAVPAVADPAVADRTEPAGSDSAPTRERLEGAPGG